jgi:integrase
MRQPKPFFREQTKSWYVQIGKKQHNLGPDEKEAWRKCHVLLSGRQVATADAPVANVLLQFLEWNRQHKQASTHEFYRRHIVSFNDHLTAGLTIAELKPHHVNRWIEAKYRDTGNNYRRAAIRSIQRAINWAVAEGMIESSPIARIKKPAETPRDALVTPEQWNELTAALERRGENGRRFLDLLTLMRQTGCRPLEARTAEARHLDRKNKCLIFDRNESKGYGANEGVDRRVVLLTEEMFALCCRLAARYPTGPLFRNSAGTAWEPSLMKDWFKRLDGRRYKLPSDKRVSFRITAYAIRHTFCTEALMRGVDPITLATIMGHKDTKMIMKVYQHLSRKTDHLRGALNRAIGLPVAIAPAAVMPSAASPA